MRSYTTAPSMTASMLPVSVGTRNVAWREAKSTEPSAWSDRPAVSGPEDPVMRTTELTRAVRADAVLDGEPATTVTAVGPPPQAAVNSTLATAATKPRLARIRLLTPPPPRREARRYRRSVSSTRHRQPGGVPVDPSGPARPCRAARAGTGEAAPSALQYVGFPMTTRFDPP